jgi:hypothetical protein
MDTTINTVREEIKDLRSEDVVVIWGGTNIYIYVCVCKNNIKVAIKYVCHFVEKN